MPTTLRRRACVGGIKAAPLVADLDRTGAINAAFFADGFHGLIPGVDIDWWTAIWPGARNRNTPVDGASMQTWYDDTGQNRTATQATSTKRPIYRSAAATVNSQPALDFDGGDALELTAYGNTGPCTIAGVVYLDPAQSTAGFVVSGYDGMIKCRTDGSLDVYSWGSSTATQMGATDRRGSLFYVEAYINGASSTWRVNAATGTAPLMAGGNTFTTRLALGSWDGNASAGDTVIAKYGFAGIYRGKLSDDPAYGDWLAWVSSTFGISTGGVAWAATITDGLGATDAADRASVYAQAATDPIGSADDTNGVSVATRTSTDALGATDGATQAQGWAATVTDPLGGLDATGQASVYLRDLVEGLGLVDDASSTGSGAITATITDGLGGVDALATAASFAQTVLEQLGALDAAAGAAVLARSAADALGGLDTTAQTSALIRAVSDTLATLDTTAQASTFTTTATDALGAVDGLTPTTAYGYTLTDGEGTTDTAVRTLVAARTLIDAEGLLDPIAQAAAFAQAVADQLALEDLLEAMAGRQVVIISISRLRTSWHVTAIEARFEVGAAGEAIAVTGASARFEVDPGSLDTTATEGASTP